MNYSLKQAASVCGKSRSTVHRALKDGKLSGTRTDDGAWSIDASELARVFPWDTNGQVKRDSTDTHETADLLSLKVTMLEAALETAHETVTDLRKRLDKADDRLTALTSQQVRPQETKGWFDRLLGR
jgi:hypothetical protein